jgi:hypothetical protein
MGAEDTIKTLKSLRWYVLNSRNLYHNGKYQTSAEKKSLLEQLQTKVQQIIDKPLCQFLIKATESLINFSTSAVVRRCVYLHDAYAMYLTLCSNNSAAISLLCTPHIALVTFAAVCVGIIATITIQTYVVRCEDMKKREHQLLRSVVNNLYEAQALAKAGEGADTAKNDLLRKAVPELIESSLTYEHNRMELHKSSPNKSSDGLFLHIVKVLRRGFPEDLADVLCKICFVDRISNWHIFSLINGYSAAGVRSIDSEISNTQMNDEITRLRLCLPEYMNDQHVNLHQLKKWNDKLTPLIKTFKKDEASAPYNQLSNDYTIAHTSNSRRRAANDRADLKCASANGFVQDMLRVTFYDGLIKPILSPFTAKQSTATSDQTQADSFLDSSPVAHAPRTFGASETLSNTNIFANREKARLMAPSARRDCLSKLF